MGLVPYSKTWFVDVIKKTLLRINENINSKMHVLYKQAAGASAHLNAVKNAGFDLPFIEKTDGVPEGRSYPAKCMPYGSLSAEFKGMNLEDYNTSGLFFCEKGWR